MEQHLESCLRGNDGIQQASSTVHSISAPCQIAINGPGLDPHKGQESCFMSRTQGKPQPPNLVVGIGASAGGLEAFLAFFAHLPSDSGMAFVLVQHLSPDHESVLTEILGRATPVPVVEATHGMRLVPDRVHVIPPDATLTIEDGRLQVVKPAPPRSSRRPIDSFFISLAKDQGDNAVSIVLSGWAATARSDSPPSRKAVA
jgi:chemotaxis response regulator CheB